MLKIVSTRDMLIKAKKERYAIPAFNIHNLETLQVVLDIAMELKSPVILACTPSTIKYAGYDYIVAMANVAANKYNIPIAIHLDHFQKIDDIKMGIDAGFKSVMIDASCEEFEENVNIVKDVVEYAHRYDVTVEAELGKLVGKEDELIIEEKDSIYTNPDAASEFVNLTDIDSLAVAIGTAHGLYKGMPKLDFLRLKEIKEKVTVPLVLHGASGVSEDLIRKSIRLGICKVNIATDLKIPFTNAIKNYFRENPNESDIRKYVTPGKNAMRQIVRDKIIMCRSKGRY